MKHERFGLRRLLAGVSGLFSRLFLCQLACLLIVTMALSPMAIAQPMYGQELAVSLRIKTPVSLAENQTRRGLDSVFGQGTSNQVEGTAEETFGKVQRKVDSTINQADGVSKQIEGRAKRELGRTQESAENLGDKLQNAAEDVGNSVQNLFR